VVTAFQGTCARKAEAFFLIFDNMARNCQ